MQVAAVQFDIAWEDKPANHRAIEAALDALDPGPGTFALLPELADTGFSLNIDDIVDDQSLPWAMGLARQRGLWLQHGYATRGPDSKGRNCAAVIAPTGDVRGVYEKVHPFSYGREIHHYTAGHHLCVLTLDDLDEKPVVCPLICYDLRFPELWRLAATAGAEVFTIRASWPDARQHHWRALLIARAIENQAYVVAVNRVGNDPHLGYAGGSLIISPMGEILAEGADRPAVLSATLDLSDLRAWRSDFRALDDRHDDLLGSIPVRSDR